MGERLHALCEAARAVEGERKSNPMNGDGSNYALTRALDAIVRLAGEDGAAIITAVQGVRDERQSREDEMYLRLCAEEAALRADQ